jgi:3-demethoxyubiquinol 3-hydroxylase
MRKLTAVDGLFSHVDKVLHTLSNVYTESSRSNPAAKMAEAPLEKSEKRKSIGLMRVNHAGEVCAQALYHGQSLTAKLPGTRMQMEEAALEEVDHLAWCKERLDELGSHVSFLSPVWYAASFSIGALAGMISDKLSLGFVAETEHQVVIHLEKHIAALPEQDKKSQAILEQMSEDEDKHRKMAIKAGAADFPLPVKKMMTLVSKVMTTTAYRI